MKVKQCIDEYLKEYGAHHNGWNDESGSILLGAWQMYAATGEEKYFSFIEEYVKRFVKEDGTIESYPADTIIDGISCGRILFFMYDKTGEEKYRKAIESVMDKLRECPRCECGNFLYHSEKPDETWLNVLYKTQPFYMAYETRYEKKEKYNDIMNQFENVQNILYNDNKEFCPSGFHLRSLADYLAALVDAMDNMSFEIYEQYRALQDAFKQALKDILQYQNGNSRLFPERIEDGSAKENAWDGAGSAMISYSILKACRMGILLKEKYEAAAAEIIENLAENDFLNDKSLAEDAGKAGMLIMAYGQYLQLKKEKEDIG